MSDSLHIPGTIEIARKWHALAERRRAHFADLYDSGRWRKYYREQSFLTQMRETVRMADAWDRVARVNGTTPGKPAANGVSHPPPASLSFDRIAIPRY
jgi:uncharacterized repeat protein (TIGR03809 family)